MSQELIALVTNRFDKTDKDNEELKVMLKEYNKKVEDLKHTVDKHSTYWSILTASVGAAGASIASYFGLKH